jgi:hypothetical protein
MVQLLQRHQAFLRLGKITKGPESALIAARHNMRELPLAPNIVAGKQALNYVLQGPSSAAAVQAKYEAVLAKHGMTKLRKDAVRLIEALVSLPVGVDDPTHQYFEVALKWLSTEFGKTNILSAVIHKDEAAQHMHVLIIPLVEGRMRGADLMGGPGIVRDRHARFVTSMQQPWTQLGVVFQPSPRQRKAAMADEVLAYLKRTDDSMWTSRVAQVIRDCIEGNPESFYLTLGLSRRGAACPAKPRRRLKAPKQRTMAQIFTRPIKGLHGAKAERYRQSDEYLRAHAVAPPRKFSAAITSFVPTLNGDAAQAQQKKLAQTISHRPVLPQLPMPSKPTRTLCSVGFAAVLISIHTNVASLVVQGSGAGVKARHIKPSDCRTRYGIQPVRQFAMLRGMLALQAKLLHWWLLKARGG